MKVLVFGSYNIDKVYSLPRLPERGETLYCERYEVHVGGKGLNQALAFKKAGADVCVGGKVGADGAYLTDYLAANGIDVADIDAGGTCTGHTIIEVDPEGQNQMILFGGANREITPAYCEKIMEKHMDAALLLTQYETSCVEELLRAARRRGVRTAMNPSPYVDALRSFPYELVDILICNESEGASLTDETDAESIVRALRRRSGGTVILTLGADGAVWYDGGPVIRVPAFRVQAADTTGAGDTFTGYCLHALLCGEPPERALRRGAAASAIEVTKPGAAETIPDAAAVAAFLKEHETGDGKPFCAKKSVRMERKL